MVAVVVVEEAAEVETIAMVGGAAGVMTVAVGMAEGEDVETLVEEEDGVSKMVIAERDTL